MNSLFPILAIGSLAMTIMALTIIFFAYMYQKKMNKKSIQLKETEAVLIATELKSAQNFIVGQNTEKRKIAKNLHDNIGNQLALIRYNIQAGKDIDSQYIDNTLERLLADVRSISHDLNKGVFTGLNFSKSMNNYLETIQKLGTTKVLFDHYGLEHNHSENLGLNIFRITQELIGNTLKHTSADTIVLEISYFKSQYLSYIYQDNGNGFQHDTDKKGIGLKNVRDRIEELNGKLIIKSNINEGLEININIELDKI